MSDPDKTVSQSPTPGSPSTPAEPRSGGLRRITLFASIATAAVVAMVLGAIVAFQSSDNVLTPQDVAQALAAEPSSSADDNPGDDLSLSPSGSASAQPGAAAGTPTVIDTVAATITISCDGTRITNATWSIKPGYRLDERWQNETSVSLRIESDKHDDLLVKAVCPAKLTVTAEPDDHRGGSGSNGGGRG